MGEFRILIADDDEEAIFLMENAFRKSGATHVLDHVNGGQPLLEYLYDVVKTNGQYPDLILLDMHMPGMDSILAMQLLKSSDMFASIPVIMCSDDVREEVETTCKKIGANGYIPKNKLDAMGIEIAKALNSHLYELKTRPDASFSLNNGL